MSDQFRSPAQSMPASVRAPVPPRVMPSAPDVGIAKAREAYDALAKQSAEADAKGNAGEVTRIKPLKMAAFAEFKRLEGEQERQAKEKVRSQHRWQPA